MSYAKHSSVSCLQSHLTSVSPRVTLAATSRMTIISEGGGPAWLLLLMGVSQTFKVRVSSVFVPRWERIS